MATDKRGAVPPDADPTDAPELSADEAEALAAEAAAAAARARAKVLRLRREAETAQAAAVVAVDLEGTEDTEDIEDIDDVEDTEYIEDIDDVDEAVEDDGLEDDPLTQRARLTAVAKYAAAFLAVVGIGALACTSAWIMVNHREVDVQRTLSADFEAAARQSVVTLMSLNFNNAKNDVQRIIDNSTGQFKEDFEAESADFAKVAEESKVVTEATVTGAAVKTMTNDTADVLVSAYSTVSNAQGAKQDPRTWRLVVSMARDSGQIKMAKVEFAP